MQNSSHVSSASITGARQLWPLPSCRCSRCACLPAAERAAWLNTLLADVWPVLDPVACGVIRAAVEPLVAQFAPPFISRIGFRRLSLGDIPLTVEGIRVG